MCSFIKVAVNENTVAISQSKKLQVTFMTTNRDIKITQSGKSCWGSIYRGIGLETRE